MNLFSIKDIIAAVIMVALVPGGIVFAALYLVTRYKNAKKKQNKDEEQK